MNSTVYFRTDMNSQIATGHMMRCLSIADEVKRQGGETEFILADENACELLNNRGHAYVVLRTKWNDMESEVPQIIALIKERQIKYLVIDSYSATADYLAALTEQTETMFIDGLHREDLYVNAILSYEIYTDSEFYKRVYGDRGTKLLLGTAYAPLRRAFYELSPKEIRGEIKNVLILSGGADPYGTVGKCVEALKDEKLQEIHAICGKYSPYTDTLKKKYENCSSIHVHGSVDDIETYMQQADLCISAAGSTLYELCACGTPTLSFVLADNQLANAKGFADAGIIAYIGDVRNTDICEVLRVELGNMRSQSIRAHLSKKMKKVVDGLGSERICKAFK